MAKEINATDIVPVAVLNKIADRVRTEAARLAKARRAPLASERDAKNKYDKRHIKQEPAKITKSQISINLHYKQVALAFDKGSKKNYPITAKKKPLLKFWGTHGRDYLVTVKEVTHPGFAARPFIKDARDNTREKNKEDLAKASVGNIRLRIYDMRRVIK